MDKIGKGERVFTISRRTSLGLLTLIKRGHLAPVMRVFENVRWQNKIDANVTSVLEQEMCRELILPQFLELGIFTSTLHGIESNYDRLEIDPSEKDACLWGLMDTGRDMCARALNDPSIRAGKAYLHGFLSMEKYDKARSQVAAVAKEIQTDQTNGGDTEIQVLFLMLDKKGGYNQ